MRKALLLFCLLCTTITFAEHLPGGNITYRCISGNQYELTLQLWRECSGTAMIGQNLLLSNDCGVQFTLTNIPLVSQQEVSPICAGQQEQTTCNGGSLIGIELYTYRTTLFLSACNAWNISWNTCCRNTSVNLASQQGLYIEARLNNAGNACFNSPVFADDMPPFVCLDQPVSYDPGVTIDGGQTLRYRLIDARRYTPAVESVLYTPPYTGGEPFTGMVLDSLTGNISFLPTLQGYVVCVLEVSVYNSSGTFIGSVMRDFPFVVQVCDNTVPDATSGTTGNATGGAAATGDYEVTACGSGGFCMDITVADADANQSLTLTSNVDIALPGATFQVAGTNPAVATICWNTTGIAAGNYNFTVTATDDACPMPGSQNYTYTVVVVEGAFGAGADGSAEICQGGTVDLSTLLTGAPGGTWSAGPVVSDAGEYTYTVASPCGDDVAVFTVTTLAIPNAGPDAATAICAGTSVDLSTLVSGDPGGTWSGGGPVVSAAGMYMYTVENSCGSDMAHFVVTVVQAPDAGLDNSTTICSDAAPFALFDQLAGTPQAGGMWTVGGAPHSPIYVPGTDGPNVFCYTVMGNAPCTSAVACVTVTENAAPDAGEDNVVGYCINAAPFNMLDSLGGTPESGGVWTSPDAQVHTSSFAPSTDIPGVYCYTVPGVAPCIDGTACLTITELPATDPYCIWLGVAPERTPTLAIAPNPSMGSLRIEGLSEACAVAMIMDLQGRVVTTSRPVASSSFVLDVPSTVANGSYLLRLITMNGSTITHRFELQR